MTFNQPTPYTIQKIYDIFIFETRGKTLQMFILNEFIEKIFENTDEILIKKKIIEKICRETTIIYFQ